VLAILYGPKGYIINSSINVEVIAALRAAVFCRELGYQQVMLEGDALQVVQTLRNENKNLSKYGSLIEKTHGVLSLPSSMEGHSYEASS